VLLPHVLLCSYISGLVASGTVPCTAPSSGSRAAGLWYCPMYSSVDTYPSRCPVVLPHVPICIYISRPLASGTAPCNSLYLHIGAAGLWYCPMYCSVVTYPIRWPLLPPHVLLCSYISEPLACGTAPCTALYLHIRTAGLCYCLMYSSVVIYASRWPLVLLCSYISRPLASGIAPCTALLLRIQTAGLWYCPMDLVLVATAATAECTVPWVHVRATGLCCYCSMYFCAFDIQGQFEQGSGRAFYLAQTVRHNAMAIV
jgi:hypothetical protein